MGCLDHKVRNIRVFQIIIGDTSSLKLNIVPESADNSEWILSELTLRLPKGLDVGFIKYEQLQKVGWRQKFGHIIDQREVVDE